MSDSGRHSQNNRRKTTYGRAVSSRSEPKDDPIDDPWAEERRARQAGRGQLTEDYGLDDLQPMSGIQKAMLFVVILIVVAVAFYVSRFWIGF